MAKRVVNGCKKRGVDVIIYYIDGNYTIFGQFWTDSSLESPGSFFYYEAYILFEDLANDFLILDKRNYFH